MTYDPTLLMPTPILVPPIVWMELKFQRTNASGKVNVVAHMPRVPYRTIYEPERYVFVPITQPKPQWSVAMNFIPGSYVLEAYDRELGGASLFMWDLSHDNWRSGEEVCADVCTVAR